MNKIRSVLITGTSTGIGRACVLRLANEGFQVFAGVRKKKDGEALQKASTGKIIPVIIDVTDEKTIATAVKTVSIETGGELYGLMNNAGVGGTGMLELFPFHLIREIIETNLLGAFNVTKHFLPMLRQSRGRIVNTASIFGKTAYPGVSAYCASKYGIEALSESLRLELRPFGITVSVIEPGAIATEIWRKGRETSDRLTASADPEIYKLYQRPIENGRKKVDTQKYLPPDTVADFVYHAFTAKKPKRHYLVGKDAKIMAFIENLPEGLRDWLYYKAFYK